PSSFSSSSSSSSSVVSVSVQTSISSSKELVSCIFLSKLLQIFWSCLLPLFLNERIENLPPRVNMVFVS
ncbi:hypothetical protein AWRI1631_71700, partial [Saccharomyces cerevisiae AWRI1631]